MLFGRSAFIMATPPVERVHAIKLGSIGLQVRANKTISGSKREIVRLLVRLGGSALRSRRYVWKQPWVWAIAR